MASDPLEAVSQAMTAIVNAAADVQTITGRADRNIVQFTPRSARTKPVIAYLALEATPITGTGGDNFHVDVLFRAEAATRKVANALLRAAVLALTPQAFAAIGADAVMIEGPDYSNVPDDEREPASTNKATAIAEAEFTIWITIPIP